MFSSLLFSNLNFIQQGVTNECYVFPVPSQALGTQFLKGSITDPSGPSYRLPDWEEPHRESWGAVSLDLLQKENLEAALV